MKQKLMVRVMRSRCQAWWPRLKALAALGAVIFVSACASNSPAPVVEPARISQIEKAGVASSISSQSAAVSASTPITPLPEGFYLVKKGDTLYSISLDHGQSYRDVAAWNNLEDPNKIQAGQQLRVVPLQTAETKPVVAPAIVESRPLDKAGETEALKREPKGGKQPYSPEALVKLQKTESIAANDTKAEVAKPVEKTESSDKTAHEKVVNKPAAKPAVVAVTNSDSGLDWDWPARGKLIASFVEGSNKGVDLAGKAGDPVLAAAAGKVTLVSSALRGYGNLVVVKHNDLYLSVYAHNSRILVKEEQVVTKGQKIAEIGNSDSDQAKLHFEIRRQGKPVDPIKLLPNR